MKPRICSRGPNSHQVKLGKQGLGSFKTWEAADAFIRNGCPGSKLPIPTPKKDARTLASVADSAFAAMDQAGFETADRYRDAFNRYVKDQPIASLPLASLTKGDCQRWLNWLEKQPAHNRHGALLSPQTVKNTRNALSRICKHAVKEGWLSADPSDGLVYRMQKRDRKVNSLTQEETFLLLTHPNIPEKDRREYKFAVWCGMRAGEINALQWTDINWQAGTITLRSGKVRKDRTRSKKTKTGKTREIPILPLALEALTEQRKLIPASCLWVWPTKKLLAHKSTTSRSDGTFKRHLRLIGAKGVDPDLPITFHSLRRTGATGLEEGWLGEGWLLTETSALLGHTTTRMTERYSDAKRKLAVKRARRDQLSPGVSPPP